MTSNLARSKARQRRAKFERIEEQLKDGSLTIRKMTKADWERFGPVKDEKAAARRAKRLKILQEEA